MTRLVPHARVQIRAFPGIVIEDSWIQFNRTYQFRPHVPTALLVGSALEFDDGPRQLASKQTLEAYCSAIGQMLAKLNFNMVNGACPGLPDVAMEAFNKSERNTVSVGLSAYDSPRAHIKPKSFAPDGFPLSADITVFCGTGFELLNVMNTLSADLLIVVGGGIGTLLEAATAVEQELTVFCLEPSGGISEDLQALLSRYIAGFKSFDVRLCEDLKHVNISLIEFADEFTKSGSITRLTKLIREIEAAGHDSEVKVEYDIAPDATSIRYSYRDVSLELFDPVLMTDRIRISRVPYKGEQILAALGTRPHVYRFQGVEVVTSPSVASVIWGPNIDTLLMLRALAAPPDRGIRSTVLEVGFGSGLISLWLASQKDDNSVLGIDVDAASVLCADWNCTTLALNDRCEFRQGVYEDGIKGRFDLIICNPPYLPECGSQQMGGIAFSGCRLLNAILENYTKNLLEGGRCLITVSSASFLDSRFRKNFEQLSADGLLSVLSETRVPLKVHEVLDNSDWLDFLQNDDGIFRRPDADYTWWHDVKVIELRC